MISDERIPAGRTKDSAFYGPASFGGDNNGIINNVLLDPKTKAMLAKMSKDAPPLAVLERAVRDGVMSPGAVEALHARPRTSTRTSRQALVADGTLMRTSPTGSHRRDKISTKKLQIGLFRLTIN